MTDLKDTRKITGNSAEKIIQKELEKQGYKILELNFRLGHNEIDIIAKKDKLVVFCEVRSKSKNSKINLDETITAKKQKSIFKVANYFITVAKLKDVEYRFDVFFVYFESGGFKIEHLSNALMFI